jgi:hypothetical protein
MCLIVIPIIGGVFSASADDVEYNSTGSVTFQAGTGVVTPPVNPTDPTLPVDPIDPINPIEPGTPGPLSIDFASNWNFGTQVISANNATYNAQPQALSDGTAVPLYAQVTDTRGTFAGTGKTASTSSAPASNVQTSGFTLTPGVAQPILSANIDEGTGTNTYDTDVYGERNPKGAYVYGTDTEGNPQHYTYHWKFSKDFTISGEDASNLNASDVTLPRNKSWLYWLIGAVILVLLLLLLFFILWKRRKKDEEESN